MRKQKYTVMILSFTICFGLVSCGRREIPPSDLEKNDESAESTQNSDKDVFDASMTTFVKEQDNITIDAQISIPERAKKGYAPSAEGQPLALREKIPQLTNQFFDEEKSVQSNFHEEDDYFFSLTDPETQSSLAYNNAAGFVFTSKEYEYCKNCIVTETFADVYNADQYQKLENLGFMNRQEAAETVRSVMEAFEIHLGDPVNVYVMDHETMEQQEDPTDVSGEYDPNIKKESWTEEDDTYYFYFQQEYDGIPMIYNPYSGEGYEVGEETTVMINASGITGALIMGCYTWEEKEEVPLISLEKAVDTFFRNYEGIVGVSYYVDQISLMLDILPGDDYTARLRPVWVFNAQMTGEGYSYDSRIIIDAETGEELTV